jgi:hypothetical protein
MEHFPLPQQRPEEKLVRSTPEASHETAEQVLKELESLSGYEEYTDITRMYRELPNESLVVRRENPHTLLNSLASDEPISIQFVGNTPYANSVEWNPKLDGPRGLDNAYMEGNGQVEGIVLVYGFEKPEGLYMDTPAESQQVFAGIDRVRVRSAAGLVPVENIRFITMRVPLRAFPESQMTEEEKDILWEHQNEVDPKRSPAFIYRGFLAKEKAADLKMAA